MTRTSQKDRVAHLLRANGSRGVHTHELRADFIANPSERIRDLKKLGWVIDCKPERLHGTAVGTRYVKISEPEAERSDGASSPSPPCEDSSVSVASLGSEPQLFDLATGQPHYRDAAA
jgi:hypothetical protein